MAIEKTVIKYNSPSGQDIFDCAEALDGFCKESGISQKTAFNAMILLVVSRFRIWGTSEQEFLDAMKGSWDHFKLEDE